MAIPDDWDFDYPNQVLQHVDGVLSYDGGTAGQAAVGDYVRGDTSGAIGKVIAVTGSAASGTYTLTNCIGLFIDNEPISLMSFVNFDTVTTTNNGFTVGATGIMTATFPGTRLCHIKGVLNLAPVATATDNLVVIISVNDANTFESANNDIDDATAEDFMVDYVGLISNGDTIKLYVENEDSTADVVVAVYVDQVNTAPASGFLQVKGA